MTTRRLALAAATVLFTLPVVYACPFCSSQGQTLTGEVAQADLIVLGTLANAKPDPNDITRGTTDLVIETVVKPNAYLAGKKVLQLPRVIPNVGDKKIMMFGSLYPRPEQLPASAV